MDEDLEKRAIEAMSVVSSLRFHAADAKNKSGYHVKLRCGCGAKQVGTVRKSSKRPTFGGTSYVNLETDPAGSRPHLRRCSANVASC
jgi:hypothetical protein